MLDELGKTNNTSLTKQKDSTPHNNSASSHHTEKAPPLTTLQNINIRLAHTLQEADLSTNKLLMQLANQSALGPTNQLHSVLLLYNEAIVPQGSQDKCEDRKSLTENNEGLSAPDATPGLTTILHNFRQRNAGLLQDLLKNLDKNIGFFQQCYLKAYSMYLVTDELTGDEFNTLATPIRFYTTLRNEVACLHWCIEALKNLLKERQRHEPIPLTSQLASDDLSPLQKFIAVIKACQKTKHCNHQITSKDTSPSELSKSYYFLSSSAMTKSAETWNDMYPQHSISSALKNLIHALTPHNNSTHRVLCLKLAPTPAELIHEPATSHQNTTVTVDDTQIEAILTTIHSLAKVAPSLNLCASPLPSPKPDRKPSSFFPEKFKQKNNRVRRASEPLLQIPPCLSLLKANASIKTPEKKNLSQSSLNSFQRTPLPQSAYPMSPQFFKSSNNPTAETPSNKMKESTLFSHLRRRLTTILGSPSSTPTNSPMLSRAQFIKPNMRRSSNFTARNNSIETSINPNSTTPIELLKA